MNHALVEKLKGLIRESSILSEVERQEWTMLLELMNDKQLLELEKILSSGANENLEAQKPLVNAPAPLPRLSLSQAILDASTKSQSGATPPAGLGHIINMPKVGKSLSQQAFKSEFKTNPPVIQTSTAKSSFLQRLKLKLKEPELPAGNLDKELKLPAHIDSEKAEEKPKEIFVLKEKPKISDELKVPVPPREYFKKASAPILEKKPEPIVKMPAALHSPLPQKIAKPEPKPQEQKKQIPTGLEQWPSSFNVNKVTPKPLVAAEIRPKAEQKASSGSAGLNTLQSAAHITQITAPQDLESLSLNSFSQISVKSLKDLVKKYGYHEVIFHLEKSPVYKNYIAAGSKALQDNNGFEGQNKDSGTLDHQSFEKFVDLLTQIQAE